MECLRVRLHTVEGLTLGCSKYKALGLGCSMISDQVLWIQASRACRDQGFSGLDSNLACGQAVF